MKSTFCAQIVEALGYIGRCHIELISAMRIETDHGTVELVDESTYRFGSSANARVYSFARNLSTGTDRASIHGVLLNGRAVAVFGKDGGCSAIHAHSAVDIDGHLYLAVGDSVVCMRLNPFEFKWNVQVDSATCFGVHHSARHQALICHGELEIARLSSEGVVMWSSSGADIFSEGLTLLPHCVEVVDFNGVIYHFDYEDGQLST